MNVRLIKSETIREYAKKYTGRKDSFDDLITWINKANWKTPKDIIETIPKSDVISDDRVIFNLKGNNYRLVCHYIFTETSVILYVCWIGNHEEYDVLCDPGSEPSQFNVWNY